MEHRRSRRARAAAVLGAAAVLAAAACTGPAGSGDRAQEDGGGALPAGADTGTDSRRTSSEATWFEPGTVWTGDFGDPHVVLEDGTYYAYASPVGGRYLPVLTSTDLETWIVHPRWSDDGPPGRPGYDVDEDGDIPVEIRRAPLSDWGKYDLNDALVRPASWGLPHQQGPWLNRDLWASSALRIGDTWYAYSAVRVAPDRFCLTAASAPSPLGPFRDISGDGPIQCQPLERDPGGSIDPAPYTDPATGRHHLLWKASGRLGVRPSSLMAVELGDDGLPLPGAPVTTLLETDSDAAWEGNTIENPSMVTHRGTTYLFYSANYSGIIDAEGRSNYASGYAICPQGPLGRCTRPEPHVPLLVSEGERQGPGGSAGFLDADGGLRMAYAAFRLGEVIGTDVPHPRHLGIVTLVQEPDGRLSVEGQREQGPEAVQRTWEELGAAAGALGEPRGPVRAAPGGTGWIQEFEGGSIVSSPATGTHVLRGAIREAWLAGGGVGGPLGLPTTDEAPTPGGEGALQHFLGGSLYWSPDTGAHWVRGTIRLAWGDTGWEQGPLGFPTSDEQEVPGGWRSEFEGGTITVDAATGEATTALHGG